MRWIQGGGYLVRERQEVIIIIEDLRGHRIVLCSRVTGQNSAQSRSPIP